MELELSGFGEFEGVELLQKLHLFQKLSFDETTRLALAAAIVPKVGTDLPLNAAADAIALVGLLALARLFISLAGMDVGTAFGTLGARREMLVGFLAEPALGHLPRRRGLLEARPGRG